MIRRHKLFDAHFHVIDPAYPLIENQGFLPARFTAPEYVEAMRDYDLVGGAVVSGSFQGFDQGYMREALKALGRRYVGVTQLPATVTDDEIVTLSKLGVRAVRFNLRRGGSESIKHLLDLGLRVFDVARWHVEIYADSAELESLLPIVGRLPQVSVDHLGLSGAALNMLYGFVEAGGHVKASGFGRVDFDVQVVLRRLMQINPNAVMFGTDLPGTRAPRPFRPSDVDLVIETFDAADAERILFANALAFYGPARSGPRLDS